MAENALPRAARQEQILTALQIDWQKKGDKHGMTIADFARVMKLSVNHKLRLLVLELVENGHIEFDKFAIPGACGFKCVYMLRGDSPYRRGGVVKAPRTVRINTRGSEQTMLWEMSE